MKKIIVYTHSDCLLKDNGPNHPEKKERLEIVIQSVKSLDIKIGIVTVPSADAQGVIDRLVQCGIKGILNYAPMKPIIPRNVSCMNIDPVLSLQSMSYYLDK